MNTISLQGIEITGSDMEWVANFMYRNGSHLPCVLWDDPADLRGHPVVSKLIRAHLVRVERKNLPHLSKVATSSTPISMRLLESQRNQTNLPDMVHRTNPQNSLLVWASPQLKSALWQTHLLP